MKTAANPRIRIACNVLIAALVAMAWCMMAFGGQNGTLATRGIGSLKYFTVLSNILEGIASIAYAWCLARTQRRGTAVPRGVHLLKYVAATAVGLTFATVMAFLGPVFGYAGMFRGANLWFHLVVPVLSMAEFCLLDTDWPLSMRATLAACAPMVLYGIVYLGNILVNGVGEWPHTNDWYGFAMAGIQWTPVVFAIMLAATWAIAALLRFANRRARGDVSAT